MNRTERLHAIVEELRRAAPRGRTATWLAARFEVSSRTIKRDMKALQTMDAGIVAEDGRGGGYALDRNRALPPLTFTVGEATAIAVAIAADPELPFRRDGRSALSRVLGAMSRSQRADVEGLAARLWIRTPTDRGRWASVLDEALRRQVLVYLDYVNETGETTRRRPVEPMAFVRTRLHWHLLGWCRMRQAGRWFRVDRVRGAWLSTERVAARDLGDTFGPPPADAQPVAL